MCRPLDYPSHRDLSIITSFDFDGLFPIPIKENTMQVTKTIKNINRRTNKLKLEDIPEETELHIDNDNDNDTDPEFEEACSHLEIDLQVLRRSLDMGLCVLCLGLGYIVSTKFRPRPKFSSFLSPSSFFFL